MEPIIQDAAYPDPAIKAEFPPLFPARSGTGHLRRRQEGLEEDAQAPRANHYRQACPWANPDRFRGRHSRADGTPSCNGLLLNTRSNYKLINATLAAPCPGVEYPAMATAHPSHPPLSIFICYARADNQPPQGWLDRVRKQLHTMRHVELLAVASDQEIRTGQKWHDFIQEKLSQADVAVLLVSADFLASAYVREHELPRVLKDFHGRGLKVLPVLLSPVPDDGLLLRFPDPVHGPEEFNLASLQAIGTPELTLMEMEAHKQVRALANLGNELSRIARERQALAAQARPAAVEVAPIVRPAPTIAEPVLPPPTIILPEPPAIIVPTLESLQGVPRPAWAKHGFGQDRYGVWAEFAVEKVVQRCRWIKPGRFVMGSPEGEAGRYDDEGPQHEVSLSGFWLADTACTEALWQAVTGHNPSGFQVDPRLPVDSISWEDGQGFFHQLNNLVPDLAAGFPTEAQWEYACRAGTTTPFSFGANITPEQVNYDGEMPYAGATKGLCRGKTVPVASLPANAWGLFEMHGNVLEWCADWFGSYAAQPQTDPEGPSRGIVRVLRGGSWLDDASYVRSAYRLGYAPGDRGQDIGLRLAPGRAGALPTLRAGKA